MTPPLQTIGDQFFNGSLPEWSNGSDCKSLIQHVGSNPSTLTISAMENYQKSIPMHTTTEAELRRGDNGSIQSIAKFADGSFRAIFNVFPYRSSIIDEDRYEEWKQFCDLSDNIAIEFGDEVIVELFNVKKPEEI